MEEFEKAMSVPVPDIEYPEITALEAGLVTDPIAEDLPPVRIVTPFTQEDINNRNRIANKLKKRSIEKKMSKASKRQQRKKK